MLPDKPPAARGKRAPALPAKPAYKAICKAATNLPGTSTCKAAATLPVKNQPKPTNKPTVEDTVEPIHRVHVGQNYGVACWACPECVQKVQTIHRYKEHGYAKELISRLEEQLKKHTEE